MISIIIPVYNAATLLPRCLDSILSQTFSDFTLILVNDGSTDGSGRICDEYAGKDGRIKVIHKENGGVSSARNTGLDISDGDFITFIDADDEIPQEYLSTLFHAITDSKADIAICDVVFSSEGKKDNRIHCKKDVMTKAEALEILLSEEGINPGPYAKLFRAAVIGDLRFSPLKIGEDWVFNLCAFDKADSFVNCKTEYHYIDNPGGAMAGDVKYPTDEALNVSYFAAEFIKQHPGMFTDKPFYLAASRVMTYIYRFAVMPETQNKKKYMDHAVKFLRNNRKDIRKNTFFPRKEKLLFLLASYRILFHNGKLTKL